MPELINWIPNWPSATLPTNYQPLDVDHLSTWPSGSSQHLLGKCTGLQESVWKVFDDQKNYATVERASGSMSVLFCITGFVVLFLSGLEFSTGAGGWAPRVFLTGSRTGTRRRCRTSTGGSLPHGSVSWRGRYSHCPRLDVVARPISCPWSGTMFPVKVYPYGTNIRVEQIRNYSLTFKC